jgi:hypothetical protein
LKYKFTLSRCIFYQRVPESVHDSGTRAASLDLEVTSSITSLTWRF